MNRDDAVTVIAACLYASRATDDSIRAERHVAAIEDEAWDLYSKLQAAVAVSSRKEDEGGGPFVGEPERP